MKSKLIIVILAFSIFLAYSQSDSLSDYDDKSNIGNKIVILEDKLNIIKNENDSLKNSQLNLRINFNQLKSDFQTSKKNTAIKIDSLKKIIESNSNNIKTTANELGFRIKDTRNSANQSITDINKTLSQNTLYWIIAILIVALFVLLVFVFLRKQIFKQKTDLDSYLQDTRKVLEEEGVKLDNKLIEVLETQLKIIKNSNTHKDKEADHTLALKVADEIIRIQKNLNRMDEKTKGLKQLTASVKRIRDNFASNGYELVEMLGKSYSDGMKVSANFIPDEDLEAGQQIISRIIKPQVNYKGIMIQSAQIEVSQG